jgi:dephospho-CoA kinase
LKRFKVGLTGGIGSGKSTVGRLFEAQGILVVDADAVAHALTGPQAVGSLAIERDFGRALLTETGALNRAAMRDLILAEPAAKAKLEGILHPLIKTAMNDAVAASNVKHSPYVVLMIPLLIESAQPRERVDRICVVDCSVAQQIERVQKRNNWPLAQIERILQLQASREQRLAATDDVVDNSGDGHHLTAAVSQLHAKYLILAKNFT